MSVYPSGIDVCDFMSEFYDSRIPMQDSGSVQNVVALYLSPGIDASPESAEKKSPERWSEAFGNAIFIQRRVEEVGLGQ